MNKHEVQKKGKTVLLLTTEYDDQLVGGLGRHVNDLVRTASKHNITFIVVTISNKGKESYHVNKGVHIFHLLPWKEELTDIIDYFRNVNFRFTQFILQDLHLQFDIIHVHDWFFAITGCQLKKLLNKPLITTFHSTEKERKQFDNGGSLFQIIKFEEQLLHLSDQIIVCSDYMKNLITNRNRDRNVPIEVIPNGVIPKDYTRTLAKEDALKKFSFINTPFLLAMGRLVKEKGFQLLLEAFAIIHHDYPELKIAVGGVGPFGKNLKQMVETKQLQSKIVFVGFLQDNERNTLLSACKMIVIPSLYEPFGIVALEGMVSAKPVLSFGVGGLKEILKQERGIIIDQVNSLHLAEKLRQCLDYPEQMDSIAQNGYDAVIRHYQWSNLIKKTLDLYEKTRCH